MRQIPTRLVLTGAILALTVSVAGAQSTPNVPAAPRDLRVQAAPSPLTASPPSAVQEKVMDGPVKQVDPLGNTISVGWLFGLFSTTLEVTEETRIAVEGAAGSLQDIREGDVVKASYEARDGKKVATAIEVTEAEPDQANDAPPLKAPAPSSVPLMGVPPGAAAPVAGAPTAP